MTASSSAPRGGLLDARGRWGAAPSARIGRRCGACRGRGLRVDRLTVKARETPPASEGDFRGVWAREAAGCLRDLVRPGQGGVAGLLPRPPARTTPPACASSTTSVPRARSSTSGRSIRAKGSRPAVSRRRQTTDHRRRAPTSGRLSAAGQGPYFEPASVFFLAFASAAFAASRSRSFDP